MFREMLNLFRSNRWFLYFSVGYLITGVGSGLTLVAIYGSLYQQAATPTGFAGAFAFSVLPSLVSASFGAYLGKRMRPFSVLILAEIGGLIALLIPFFAVTHAQIALLVLASILPNLFGGVAIYSYSIICKRAFGNNEYRLIAVVETVLFSAVTILGTGVGAVIYPLVESITFFLIDGFSFVCSIWLLNLARHSLAASSQHGKIDSVVESGESTSNHKLLNFSSEKRLAIFLLPMCALVTAPAMALLPTKGSEFQIILFGGLIVNPVVILLFARGIGQMLGPFLSTNALTGLVFNSNVMKLGMFLTFIAIYYFVFSSKNLVAMWLAVVVAHAITNILFTTAYSFLYTLFPEQEVGFAIVRTNQLMMLVLGSCSALSGILAEHIALKWVILIFSCPGMLFCCLVFWINNRRTAQNSCS